MEIYYTLRATEQLASLPGDIQSRIKTKLRFFVEQEDPMRFAKRLAGVDAYRFRIGEYRVIFEVADQTVVVLLVVKRDKAYRDL